MELHACLNTEKKQDTRFNTLVAIMQKGKPASSASGCCQCAVGSRIGKPTQPIAQTFAKIDPSTMSDDELAAIVQE